MPTRHTYADLVVMARERGTYEHLRVRLTNLINAGYSRREIPVALGVSAKTVEIALASLDLHTMGRSGAPKKAHVVDEETTRVLTAQRAEEHHWVRCFRREYGTVGRGFSIA